MSRWVINVFFYRKGIKRHKKNRDEMNEKIISEEGKESWMFQLFVEFKITFAIKEVENGKAIDDNNYGCI